jgi:hypothetical protein
VAAALLHDVVEDCAGELLSVFGRRDETALRCLARLYGKETAQHVQRKRRGLLPTSRRGRPPWTSASSSVNPQHSRDLDTGQQRIRHHQRLTDRLLEFMDTPPADDQARPGIRPGDHVVGSLHTCQDARSTPPPASTIHRARAARLDDGRRRWRTLMKGCR